MKAGRLLLLAALAMAAQAHVGSPDVYLEGDAGPYRLFVTVRPPTVIPGVAELEIRSETPGVVQIRAVPLPIGGAGAKFAPIADKLKGSAQDAQYFTGSLWMMQAGSWQVRITVDGARGQGMMTVPVPSLALTTKKMQLGLGAILSVLGLFLVTGLVAMVGAGVREAKLAPGVAAGPVEKKRGKIGVIVGAVVVAAVVLAGNAWWNGEAAAYGQNIYKPLKMDAALANGVLTLKMTETGWMQPVPGSLRPMSFIRKTDDLTLDHGHLMHLYAIRQPGLDVVYHLHPDQIESGQFRLALPSMPAGTYRLYADIVHANGFPETLVATLTMPALQGRALSGDDASATAPNWQRASVDGTTFTLPDGYKMTWLRGNTPLRAKQATPFRFRLTTPDGGAPKDMAFYMGMLGHAAFVKTDGTVFAHIHPNGSVSMAALLMAQQQAGVAATSDMAGMDMPGMHTQDSLPNEVMFPYGFPTPGRYRIFVQMKHAETVETGVFDAEVR